MDAVERTVRVTTNAAAAAESAFMNVLVHLHGSSYAVTDSAVAVIESQILEAVRAGGAFIDFIGPGNRPTRVLVSPGASVRIEKLPEPAEEDDGDEEHPDFAYWDLNV